MALLTSGRRLAEAGDPTIAELLAKRPNLAMHAMDGLCLDGVPLAAIGTELDTPTWVISATTIKRRAAELAAAFADARLAVDIHFAVKANDHLAVLRVLARAGAGADVVSAGELLRARHAGLAGERIVYSGVGKSARELRLAIDEGIGQINVESAEELGMISDVAAAIGRTVAVTLRVNPDIDAGTHAKITTGRADTKFGIPIGAIPALYARAAALPGVRPIGLAVHIGSQIASMAPFRAAYGRIAEVVRALRLAGHVVELIDCGGGLAIDYRDTPAPSPAAWAATIGQTLGGLGARLVVEPGRWLVGPAGVLLASVILVKPDGASRFVVLDAAMNDLARPAMYDAWHAIVPLAASDAAGRTSPADVVGPVCESSDTFARSRSLPRLAAGSRVALLDAGAYGAVMSSTYNARPLAAQALIDDEAPAPHWVTIRPRQRVQDLWSGEIIPSWLT